MILSVFICYRQLPFQTIIEFCMFNAIYALNQTIASGDLLSLSGSIQDPTIIEQNVSNPHQIDRGLNNLLGRSLFEDLEVEPSMLITTGRPHLNSSLCDASLVAGHFRLDMNGTTF